MKRECKQIAKNAKEWALGISCWMLGERRIYKRNLEGIFRAVSGSVTQSFNSFATLGTVAHQAPLSKEFSVKNTGVGCHFLHQGIFLTQGLNPPLLHLLHWQYPARQANNHKMSWKPGEDKDYWSSSSLTCNRTIPPYRLPCSFIMPAHCGWGYFLTSTGPRHMTYFQWVWMKQRPEVHLHDLFYFLHSWHFPWEEHVLGGCWLNENERLVEHTWTQPIPQADLLYLTCRPAGTGNKCTLASHWLCDISLKWSLTIITTEKSPGTLTQPKEICVI